MEGSSQSTMRPEPRGLQGNVSLGYFLYVRLGKVLKSKIIYLTGRVGVSSLSSTRPELRWLQGNVRFG